MDEVDNIYGKHFDVEEFIRAAKGSGLWFHGVMRLDELFAKHDEDNDGVLDLKEFTSLCQAPGTTGLKWGSQMLSDEQTIVTVSN